MVPKYESLDMNRYELWFKWKIDKNRGIGNVLMKGKINVCILCTYLTSTKVTKDRLFGV